MHFSTYSAVAVRRIIFKSLHSLGCYKFTEAHYSIWAISNHKHSTPCVSLYAQFLFTQSRLRQHMKKSNANKLLPRSFVHLMPPNAPATAPSGHTPPRLLEESLTPHSRVGVDLQGKTLEGNRCPLKILREP